MRRILAISVALALVAVVAALVWIARSLDGIVEEAIEEAGTALLDTQVTVGSVSIDLRGGTGTIRDIEVRNPEGFSSSDAFAIDEVVLVIDLASVTRSPVVLNEVTVRTPDVLAEANARGLNLDALRRAVERSAAAEADAEVADETEPRRIAIRRLEIEGAKARSDLTALGGSAEEIEAPGLVLQEVGGADGATPGALGKQVLSAWLSRVATAAARHQARKAVGDALEDALGDDTGTLGDAVKGLLD